MANYSLLLTLPDPREAVFVAELVVRRQCHDDDAATADPVHSR